jgi:putative addiction module component (TIGR02574 family)
LQAYPYLEPEDIDVALAYTAWRLEEREEPITSELSAAQRAELSRRDAELEANPEIALSWEEIRTKVEGHRHPSS